MFFQIKQKALVFAEMEAFYRKRQDEDDQLKNDIEDLQMLISKYVHIFSFKKSIIYFKQKKICQK